MEERGANPKGGFTFANHVMWEVIVHYYRFMLYSRCTSLRIPIFKLLRISTLYPFLFARSIKMVKFGSACFVILWAYYQCGSVVEQTSGAVDQHYVFYSYTLIEFSVLSKEKKLYIQRIMDQSYVLFYSFLVEIGLSKHDTIITTTIIHFTNYYC